MRREGARGAQVAASVHEQAQLSWFKPLHLETLWKQTPLQLESCGLLLTFDFDGLTLLVAWLS